MEISKSFIKNNKYTVMERIVYLILFSKVDKNNYIQAPEIKKISTMCKVSRKVIYKTLEDLENLGAIEKENINLYLIAHVDYTTGDFLKIQYKLG